MNLPLLDRWQYRLSQLSRPDAVAIGGMQLEVGEGLPIVQVTDLSGASVGLLLGFPIDLNSRRMINGSWQTPIRLGDDVDDFVRESILLLGGRFIWIFDTKDDSRIYPDCVAQIPCVFDTKEKLVGSTAHALMENPEYDARFQSELFDTLSVDGEGWFIGGLTAHRGLDRLLPNHFLDLKNWEVRRSRFGPGDQVDPLIAVEGIIETIQAQIEAMVTGPDRVAIALTAGLDSRTVVACARNYLSDIDFVTISGGDRHEIDSIMAARIAKDMMLRHISLPRVIATAKQKATFIRRGGHCNGDSNAAYHPSIWPLRGSHVFVGGVGGEMARPSFWRTKDAYDTNLTAENFIGRLGLPKSRIVIDALNSRISDLKELNSFQLLDIVFQENRYGSWYGVQFCADPSVVRYAPLLTARTVDLMMQLPPDWKKTDRLAREIVTRLWPELDRYPYNSLGKYRDLIAKIRRAGSDPRLVIKQLRKIWG